MAKRWATVVLSVLLGATAALAATATPAEAAEAAEAAAPAEPYTIPADKVDEQKVFWGSAGSFVKPGEVAYKTIVKATPEYASIKKNKIKSGTAKYWILLSKASDHAVRLISEVGEESEYDFIAAKDYLGSLDPPIPAEDITDLVLKRLKGGK